jgi:hypothetical protein
VLTATDWNTYIRDNLEQTMTAKATTPGSHFVSLTTNQIVERTFKEDSDDAEALFSGTTFAHPGTGDPGPVVTVSCGTRALVFWSGRFRSVSAAGVIVGMSIRVTGATAITADDAWMIEIEGSASGDEREVGMSHLFTGLTPGTNSFTCLYKVSSVGAAGTGRVSNRQIIVIPL